MSWSPDIGRATRQGDDNPVEMCGFCARSTDAHGGASDVPSSIKVWRVVFGFEVAPILSWMLREHSLSARRQPDKIDAQQRQRANRGRS
jgi:hypothetical protein